MIRITNDFFNKVATELRSTYFPNENHGTTDNKNYQKTTNSIELFNNGCLTYDQFIDRLTKSCVDTTENINLIVKKYIINF